MANEVELVWGDSPKLIVPITESCSLEFLLDGFSHEFDEQTGSMSLFFPVVEVIENAEDGLDEVCIDEPYTYVDYTSIHLPHGKYKIVDIGSYEKRIDFKVDKITHLKRCE